MKLGPVTEEQMKRLGMVWEQGEHILVTGPTGSGKTALARHIVQHRIDRKGHVVVFVGKQQDDKTIVEDYSQNDGWVRWKSWKSKPSSFENKVLLYPDVTKIRTNAGRLAHQKEIFGEAFDELGRIGKWTVQVDEGLYTCHPKFLNMEGQLAMLHALGRSANLSIVTNAQRPSHLPLIVYGSAAHIFAGRTREQTDMKRLAETGGKKSARELAVLLSKQQRHDFTWVPIAPDWEPESVNIAR